MERSPRREAVAVAVIVFLAYLALRSSGSVLIGSFNDDGAYVALGKALADGEGYRLIYLVGTPVAEKYPPALPLVLAIAWKIGGSVWAVDAAVGIVNPLVCGAAAGVLWWLGRERLGISPLPLALGAAFPFLLEEALQFNNLALAEPYFLGGWALALALTPHAARPRGAVALGLALAVTVLFRTAAVALIPAFLGALLWRRVGRRAVALCAAAVLVPLVAWALLHAHLLAAGPLSPSPDEVPYWRWLPLDRPAALPAYLASWSVTSAAWYFREFSAQLSGITVVGYALCIAGAGGAAWSGVRLARSEPALVLSVAASLAVLLVWPFTQLRLLVPILPVAGLLTAAALDRALQRLAPRVRLAAAVTAAALALTVGLRQVDLRRHAVTAFAENRPPPPRDASPLFMLSMNTRYLHALAQWARASTTPEDRLLVDLPAGTFLYTGRVTVSGSPTEPAFAPSVFEVPGRFLAARIVDDGVTVVAPGIRGTGLERDVQTVARECPQLLQRQAALVTVYRVSRSDTCVRGFLAAG